MVEKLDSAELDWFREYLQRASEEVSSWPPWKRGVLEASSRQFNEHERGEAVDEKQILVFECITVIRAAGNSEDLLRRVMVPDHITTREEVREWLTNQQGIGGRFMVVSTTRWDVAEIQSKTIKTTEWVGKARATEDGNGPL